MEKYLYLSLIPESLIASMLSPEEFGNYYAVGTKYRTSGQAIFFEVNQDFESDYFDLSIIENKCVPHKNGNPKKSAYLSVYRVLENIPLSALGKLYLATGHGKVIGIEPQTYNSDEKSELHLYQDICPVTPRVASKLAPSDFCKFVTNPQNPISVKNIVFTELSIGDLAEDPMSANIQNLPYANVIHLQDCLSAIKGNDNKPNKIVIRILRQGISYRMIKNGFFVGNNDEMIYYPLPSHEELNSNHYEWWRSAQEGFNI